MPAFARSALLFLILSPIFISLQKRDLLLLRPLDPNYSWATIEKYDNALGVLPVAVALLAIPLIPLFIRGLTKRNNMFIAVLALSMYFMLIAAITAISTRDAYPVLAAIQYIFPLSCIPIGYLMVDRYKIDLPKLLYIYALLHFSMISVGILYFWQILGNSYTVALHLAGDVFYGLFSIIPTTIALALVFSLFMSPRIFRGGLIATCLLSVLFLAVWSRTTLIVVAGSLTISLVILVWHMLARQRELRSLATVCGLILCGAVILPQFGMIGERSSHNVEVIELHVVPEEFEGKLEQDGDLDSDTVESIDRQIIDSLDNSNAEQTESWLESSNRSRLAFLREGLRRWSESPFFGIMFKPDDVAVIYRKVVEKKQIFTPHNQYVDVLMKTGLIGLIGLASFYFWFVARPLAVAAFSAHNPLPYIGWLSILIALAVGANFQNFFMVWTSAVPIGIITGYLLRRWEEESA